MTLKTVLRNFLNHVQSVEAKRLLGEEDLFESEFQKLKELTEQLKHDPNYNCNEGELDVNRRKNRYKDILPYDYTRVVISVYPGVPGSDFINANYIKGASGSRAYIASQGPLPNTVADFWRMIWECDVRVIVMACNERESGKYKCECYWPEEGEQRQYGNITIEQVQWRRVCPDFLLRTLRVRSGEEERSLCQFHYTTWPDHGVPTSVQPILDLVRLIRDCQAYEATPILIHCSAGCGRTGTICAIDYVWELMRLGKLPEKFSLFQIISDMRRQRIAMVQTKEQYVLVHRAVSSLFEQQLRVIDSHTYENLDEDGEPLVLKESQQKNEPEHIYEDVRVLTDMEETQGNSKTEEKHLYDVPAGEFSEELVPSLPGESSGKEGAASEMGSCALPPRRNSQTLQKLRRDESVKRLISGWGKSGGETSADAEKPEPEDVRVVQTSKEQSPPIMVTKDAKRELTHAPNKSEKLIGKATVIRRPSIARLKALFEKSHNTSDVDDNGRKRRPLGRSHSHHVPRGTEESAVGSTDKDRSRKVTSVLPKDEMMRLKGEGNEEKASTSFDGQQLLESGKDIRVERAMSWYEVDDTKTKSILQRHIEKTDVREGETDTSQEGRPPELPIKRKFLNHHSSSKTLHESPCQQVVNQQRCSVLEQSSEQNYLTYLKPQDTDFKHITSSDVPPRLPEKKVLGKQVCVITSAFDSDIVPDSDVRRSNCHLVDCSSKEILPFATENPTREHQKQIMPMDKQMLAQHQKIRRGAENVAFCYTNVSLTTKKNIAQIENTLKHHPRGAIIDLTSRTSYVENQNGCKNPREQVTPVEANHFVQEDPSKKVEYETVWVKRKSSVDPTFHENRLERVEETSSATIQTDSRPTVSNNDSKAAKDESNKNLLLHSPPLRTRRPHLARTFSKTKSVLDAEQENSAARTNISSDQEINKAVKELNTLGYLLDALASDTLDNLKIKEKGSSSSQSNSDSKEHTPEPDQSGCRPVLPQKQRSLHPKQSGVPKQVILQPNAHYGPVVFPNDQSIAELEHQYGQINRSNAPNAKVHPNAHRLNIDYEFIYPLQKSASAPHAPNAFTEHVRQSAKERHLSTYMCWDAPAGAAPPKPPRSFTHVPQQQSSDMGSTGRLIVSVASPKQFKPDDAKMVVMHQQYLESSENFKPLNQPMKFPVSRTSGFPDRPSRSLPQRVNDLYSSTPSSPSSKGPPHPSYYQTYPIYPEIHSVRSTSQPKPIDPSSAHHPVPPPYNHRHVRNPVHGPSGKGTHLYDPPSAHHPGSGLPSSTPDYGEVPVVPVYTTVRPEQDRHRVVQWDTSVDFQQQVKNAKHYENIYDVPKDCWNTGSSDKHDLPPFAERQGPELRHSQSDASVYHALRNVAGGKHTVPETARLPPTAAQVPIYSQVVKPKRQPVPGGPMSCPGSSSGTQAQRRSRDDMDLQPVAPPRNKRHLHLRRSMADGGLMSQSSGPDFTTIWHSDSEEEIPPAVPAKTKGAYIIVNNGSDSKGWHGPVPAPPSQGGLGSTLSRALGKLNLLSKLASRGDVNQPATNRQASVSSNCATKEISPSRKPTVSPRSPIFGFPNRLNRKPKGPREPPEQWTQV